MPAGDFEAALRAVERQAAAMQAIERKVAALYRRALRAACGLDKAGRAAPEGAAEPDSNEDMAR